MAVGVFSVAHFSLTAWAGENKEEFQVQFKKQPKKENQQWKDLRLGQT